ncbi:D-alanyl-D-alanine carboxypeptidase/D-alanyl-D-alanine endopeptidase [Fodinicola feengrottensis]|uniref:D-alanyl-D-alanine carboxypeptidase/D-alanyl-D-alanine-endopeptidase n=1 Tax=Fodinicola feengrottensis TaxID=435914 RepID=A0ABP4UJI7_9ACTN|nr:D-alanyl-D-alanine carboxypeptidase/D-alanyl-D-alanine-endopeptidase [Fodinicola feengrottensis]
MVARAPRWLLVTGLVAAVLVGIAGTAGGAVVSVAFAAPIRGYLTPLPPTPEVAYPVPGLQAAPQPVLAAAGGADPTAEGLASQLGQALADSRLGPSVSVSVRDGNTGESLYGHTDSSSVPAASATKLLTATAALESFGPDYRFKTRAVAGAAGAVYLVGGGDPTLGIGPKTAYPDAARLDQLAAQVRKALGGASVSKIIVDTSLFSGPTQAAGWDPTDVSGGDVAPITALMVDGGRTSPSEDARGRTTTPAVFAAQGFAQALGVPSAYITSGKAPAGARELGSVSSPMLSGIVYDNLQISDNVISEVLAHQVGLKNGQPGSFAGGAAAVIATLSKLGVPAGDATLSDASGLSRNDRVSARLLSSVLATASSPAHPNLRPAITGLPVAGYSGTLDSRFQDGKSRAGAGLVRAKTGTLSGVSSLAGTLVDSSGQVLVFAVVADKVPNGGTSAAEDALDAVAAKLAGCGCS